MIELKEVSKSFGAVQALDNISLNIPKGVIAGIIGYNGSGKSTLLRVIAGLQIPSRGTVKIDGIAAGKHTKEHVSYSAENNTFYRWMTISEVLNMMNVYFDDFDLLQAKHLLKFMELEEKSTVGSLSKGMSARLRLVCALARQAKVQLLDEPLSGIDPLSRKKIIEALLTEFRVAEQTILLSTHEVVEAEALFDQVLVINRGRVVLSGWADKLRDEYDCSIQDLFGKVV